MSRIDVNLNLIHGIGETSHFNYKLFPNDDKSKPTCGIKKNEVYDFIIDKEKETMRKYPTTFSKYLDGCNYNSYELYTNDFNITSNKDCNNDIKKEMLVLIKEIRGKRQKLNYILESYPYGSIFDKSCARFNKLLRWSGLYGNTFEMLAALMLLLWIVLLIGMLELIICYPFYCIINLQYSEPTAEVIEDWFNHNICSNSEEFDAEKLDGFVVERIQQICNKLNDKYSQSASISLMPVTYLDQVEIASYDIPDGEGSNMHVQRHNDFYDNFLILNDDKMINDAI